MTGAFACACMLLHPSTHVCVGCFAAAERCSLARVRAHAAQRCLLLTSGGRGPSCHISAKLRGAEMAAFRSCDDFALTSCVSRVSMGIGSSHSRGRVELERKVCRHLFPFKYVLKPWPLERDVGGGQRGELRGQFMANTEQGVYQYVVVRTLFAVLELLAHLVGLHGEGEWQVGLRCLRVRM